MDRETVLTPKLRHAAGRRDEDRVSAKGTLAHAGCHLVQGQGHVFLVGDGFAKRIKDGTILHPSSHYSFFRQMKEFQCILFITRNGDSPLFLPPPPPPKSHLEV